MEYDIKTQGFQIIRGAFSEKDLSEVYEYILSNFKDYLHFDEKGTPVQRLNSCRVIDEKSKIRVDEIHPLIKRFASESSNLADIFVDILNAPNRESLLLSEFCDFRMNTPKGVKLRTGTGWHQDVQTDYCYFPKQIKHGSATCWLALSDAVEENSIELIPGSHRPRKINYQDYRNHQFSPTDLPGSEFWGEPILITASPGDIVVFDQFLWHRSVVNSTPNTRFSFDIRFLNTAKPIEEFDADFRLLRFRVEKAVYGMYKRLFSR